MNKTTEIFKFNENLFMEKLAELRKEFPECYVEAWTPVDYLTANDFNKSVAISQCLYDYFDAEIGTNWNGIKLAKDGLV